MNSWCANQAAENIDGTIDEIVTEQFDHLQRWCLRDRATWTISQANAAASQRLLKCRNNLRIGDADGDVLDGVVVTKVG